MKREVIEKIFLALIMLTFLLSGIFAAPPDVGTCSIVPRTDCDTPEEGHILMGVSSATNAHAESPDVGTYSHVLCCAFGNGNTDCIENPNPIIKLSSATNAHGESPTENQYTTQFCYEDLICSDFTDECGIGDAINNPISILSLSSTTNAHIGGINDYVTKICCSSSTFAGCAITNAEWTPKTAIEGQDVHLDVVGTLDCDGKSITLNVGGGKEDVTIQPVSVSFVGATGSGIWKAERQTDTPIIGSCGLTGTCDFYFDASLTRNPLIVRTSDAPELIVNERNWEDYEDVNSCDDYDNEDDCKSDVMNVAILSSPPEVDCESDDFACKCTWSSETSVCNFGYTEITEETCGNSVDGCNYGCTLCNNPTTGLYCHVGNSCPTGEIPTDNNDNICDVREGCLSEDCIDGDADTCAEGLYCIADKCSSVEGPTIVAGQCLISQEILQNCDESGEKVVRFTATWTGSETDSRRTACEEKNGEFTVKCPAQIQLPFFDYIGVIISIIIIAGIYIGLFFKNKFKKRK